MDEPSDESIEQFRARARQRWGHLSSADLDRLAARRPDLRARLPPQSFAEQLTHARRALESLQRDLPLVPPSVTPWSPR